MKTLAVIFWLLCGLACLSHLAGNETAINGVIGAGLGALVFTVCAFVERY